MFALAFLFLALASPSRHRGFENIAAQAGVHFRHAASKTPEKYLPEAMGAGVAMFDYDNDGYLDLFFVNGASLPGLDKSDPRYWNRLYRNNRDGTFTDVTDRAGLQGAGYGMGAAAGDYNHDGHTDLYVTALGRNYLYRNNGDGTFTDVTDRAGVRGSGWSVSAAFTDYDRDGNLDLIVTRYLDWDFSKNIRCGDPRPSYRAYCHPDQFQPVTHLVYRNNGDGTFTDASLKAGLSKVPSKGLGIAINDFDQDGWPDLAIANDSFPQQLFRNNRDGSFREVATELGLAYDEDGNTFAGMGIDFADYDQDGWPDIFINALFNQRYALFRNQKGRAFDYISSRTGLANLTANHSGWGAKFIDYDNDGTRALFIAQGHVMDNIELTQPTARYLETPLLLKNQNGRFSDVSKQSGAPFTMPVAARGAAFGDLNNDGSIDVAINTKDGPAVVLINRAGTGNHWIMLDIPRLGARVHLVSDSGREQHGYVTASGSYASSNDPRLHFGLGPDRRLRTLEITWPTGVRQSLHDIPADQILKLNEPAP